MNLDQQTLLSLAEHDFKLASNKDLNIEAKLYRTTQAVGSILKLLQQLTTVPDMSHVHSQDKHWVVPESVNTLLTTPESSQLDLHETQSGRVGQHLECVGSNLIYQGQNERYVNFKCEVCHALWSFDKTPAPVATTTSSTSVKPGSKQSAESLVEGFAASASNYHIEQTEANRRAAETRKCRVCGAPEGVQYVCRTSISHWFEDPPAPQQEATR